LRARLAQILQNIGCSSIVQGSGKLRGEGMFQPCVGLVLTLRSVRAKAHHLAFRARTESQS
jgi:hypothetical protein